MVDKKAFLKTLEAVIAIVILFVFISYVRPAQSIDEEVLPKDVELVQNTVVRELETNQAYRSCIISLSLPCAQALSNAVSDLVPKKFEYHFDVCSSDGSDCAVLNLPADRSVYAKSYVVSTDLQNLPNTPKQIRLYLWRKLNF